MARSQKRRPVKTITNTAKLAGACASRRLVTHSGNASTEQRLPLCGRVRHQVTTDVIDGASEHIKRRSTPRSSTSPSHTLPHNGQGNHQGRVQTRHTVHGRVHRDRPPCRGTVAPGRFHADVLIIARSTRSGRTEVCRLATAVHVDGSDPCRRH